MENRSSKDRLWEELVTGHTQFINALHRFLHDPAVDRVQLVRQGFRQPHLPTILYVARYLSNAEQQALFPEWVEWACGSQGSCVAFREIIAALPRAWVMERIRAVVEPLLAHANYDDYQLIFGLYRMLDHTLVAELAQRALTNTDAEIREAGQDFREWLEE